MTLLENGVYAVTPTPFKPDGTVDLHSVGVMTESLVGFGIDGLLILGVMGEATKLLDGERQAVLERFVEAADGAAKIIVGTNHAGSIPARELTRVAEDSGADAVMLSPPPLAKPNPQAVLDFFGTVASGSSIEIVLQDHPAASGVHMSPDLIGQLANDIDQMSALKLEDPPTPPKITAVLKEVGSSLRVFGGLGGLKLVEELDRGSSGTMTGFAYPEVLVQIFQLHQAGCVDEAREVFNAFLPLILFESQPLISLTVRKRLYMRRGLIATDYARGPAPTLDNETVLELERLAALADLQLVSA
ncbi:MAG: dihydrodipicolinate synthase family protein [Acidimicrobiia bacterium]|nr:dihydrodipicolinate synthase family protein [Acidimicrobiia bacterium]MDH3462948.1 dihydrodipicolinate synthase family protein [Acidimicrobiia bacterium]